MATFLSVVVDIHLVGRIVIASSLVIIGQGDVIHIVEFQGQGSRSLTVFVDVL